MATLSSIEKRKLERLLGMSSGKSNDHIAESNDRSPLEVDANSKRDGMTGLGRKSPVGPHLASTGDTAMKCRSLAPLRGHWNAGLDSNSSRSLKYAYPPTGATVIWGASLQRSRSGPVP